MFSAHYQFLSLSLILFFCFSCPASLTFIPVSFCCSFSLCATFSLSVFVPVFCYFWNLSACFSVSLLLFLVRSLTLFCSPCASVCVCLFSWCLKLPLLQSGCWDSGPKLPALSPRPLHFLNFLQLVSGRRAGCRENRKEVDPRGLGPGPLCPSCPWAVRDGSAENILGEMPAWHPAHLGRGGSWRSKTLMLGAERPVPVGEEEYWYQTRLGVRAEPLVSLGMTRPHSLCISLLHWPVGIWHQIRMAGSLFLSYELEHGAEEPSEGPGHPFFLG